jgi:hypothetical protein
MCHGCDLGRIDAVELTRERIDLGGEVVQTGSQGTFVTLGAFLAGGEGVRTGFEYPGKHERSRCLVTRDELSCT